MRVTLLWFRDDLRIEDNPALAAAAKSESSLVCVFVLEEGSNEVRAKEGAALWWLHHSLDRLSRSLAKMGGKLVLRKGNSRTIIPECAATAKASLVLWNRRYSPQERAIDAAIEVSLAKKGIGVETFNARLLHEPGDIRSQAGEPMRVFSPFWKAALRHGEPRAPVNAPKRLPPGPELESDQLEGWRLLPTAPDWSTEIARAWQPGSAAGLKRLGQFLDGPVRGYAKNRDRPDFASTSRLSPYLRFGEISPHQIWHAACHAQAAGNAPSRDIEKLLTELGWREFSYHLLGNLDDIARTNVQRRFDAFPWRRDQKHFQAWTKGLTGYPLVDAGMRQLWTTGWMHNRVRMITASFLIKHLLIDWRRGEDWFWQTLVDADPASNAASWQWVAGSGADAAPYFRVFNPTLQAVKFDPRGDYVRTFVSELAGLPAEHIHQPAAAPSEVLAAAGVVLGKTYPHPIVDHSTARHRALAAFHSLKAA